MKTAYIKLFAFGLTLLLMSIVYIAHADNKDENNYYKSIDNLEDYFESREMIIRLENNLKSEINVLVYNSDNKLIMAGTENEDKIKCYINLSDLLTEIDGTKYYRLSYK